MSDKKYELSIDPRILELLGPNLYTNIYYVLAELIANAYDADAHNVYVIATQDSIIVEDDGSGMSYTDGDIDKFLNVAGISRTNEEDSLSSELKVARKTADDIMYRMNLPECQPHLLLKLSPSIKHAVKSANRRLPAQSIFA